MSETSIANALELARRIIKAQIDARNRVLSEKRTVLLARRSVGGQLRSGATITETGRLASDEIRERALIHVSELKRVADRLEVPRSAELASGLKNEFDTFLKADLDTIKAFANECLHGLFPAQMIERGVRPVQDAYDEMRARLHPELDLFVLSKDSAKDGNRGIISVTGHGNVIQTGDRSSATVNQALTSSERDKLAVALEELVAAIKKSTQMDESRRAELVDAAATAQIEIKRDVPNRTTLRGIFSVLSESVQALDSVKGAWEAVKAAGAAINLQF